MAKQPSVLKDRAKTRSKRTKLNADTLAIQDHYVEQGYKRIDEIAFLAANDAYEDVQVALEQKGLYSPEYSDKMAVLNNALKTALPYFAQPAAKAAIIIKEETDPAAIEDSIRKLLGK